MEPAVCFLQDNLYDPSGSTWTGTHLQNFQVASALRDAGCRVSFVVVCDPGVKLRVSDIYDSIDVRQVTVHNRLRWANGWGKVRSVLGELAPEFVYVRGRSWLVGLASAYARSSGAVAIWASNGEDGCERWKFTRKARSSSRGPIRLAARFVMGAAEDMLYSGGIRRAGLLINQTQTQQQSLRREFGRDGIIIHSIQEVPEGSFVKTDPPVVLWVGQLVAEKRPEIFLDLVERSASVGAVFRVIGRPSSSTQLSEAIERLSTHPRFQYLGAQSRAEVLEQMRGASLIVNTSAPGGDGIPNSLVEAWLREVAVLSDELDPDELIERYGLGVVVGGEPAKFVSEFARLINDRVALAGMGRRARQVALREFSAESNVTRYLLAMESLKQGTNGGHR